MKNQFEKTVEFSPAFDRRNDDPKKNYGVHGVGVRFILKGKKGAVQFLLYTNWMLPHVQNELDAKQNNDHLFCHPMPADLGYHSPIPTYEGQSCIDNECKYLDGKPCYYDGSGLNAEPIYDILLTSGSDGVWIRLEEYYKQVFEK